MISKKVSFVIPVFNESDNIRPLYNELSAMMTKVNHTFEIIFVDDGSTDNSVNIIQQLGSEDKRIFFIELSRNFGQQSVLKAGIDVAKGDCVISMDCDLQHPSDIVLQLIEKWEQGFEVVYTRRLPDHRLPWVKRKTSNMFYNILNCISDTKLESGVADFRLLNRNVVDTISGLHESGLFLRGLVKWVGFRQAKVDYHARERLSGVSKYSFRKMFSFASRGLISFSTRPLYLVFYCGIFLLSISSVFLLWLAINYLMHQAISTIAVVVGVILLFISLQMLLIGIMSVYMSRLVIESRHRPLYVVRTSNYN